MPDKEPDLPDLPEIPKIPELPVAPESPEQSTTPLPVDSKPEKTASSEPSVQKTILDEVGISREQQENMLPLARKVMEYAVEQGMEARAEKEGHEPVNKKKKPFSWIGFGFVLLVGVFIVFAECGGIFMDILLEIM